MTKTQPTHKKLPRAKLIYVSPSLLVNAEPTKKQIDTQLPTALVPCHTPAQARAICKAAPFLRMTEGEQVEVVAKWLNAEASGKEFRPFFMDVDRRRAKSLLHAMNLGGASK